MTGELQPVNDNLTPAEQAAVKLSLLSSRSPATRTAYRTAWASWEQWCADHDTDPLPAPPLLVAAWLASGTASVATLEVRLAAVNAACEEAGFARPGQHPGVKQVMAGVRRSRGTRQRQAEPLRRDEIHALIRSFDYNNFPAAVAAYRDAALLLAGFAGAFRRSELCDLTLRDVTLTRAGELRMLVRRSKTDQTGRGAVKAVPPSSDPTTCVPCAVLRWVDLRDCTTRDQVRSCVAGMDRTQHRCTNAVLSRPADTRPLLCRVSATGRIDDTVPLSGTSVNRIIKRRAAALGWDTELLSGHSLRAGFVTEAFHHGATSSEIRKQTGHKTDLMVDRYNREHAPLVGNAVTRIVS